MGLLAEKLSTDPWTLLWRTPYTQLLCLTHAHLRVNEAWTVPETKPEPVVNEGDFERLLSASEQ